MQNSEYLTFTKKERRGIIILVSLILMAAILPKFLSNKDEHLQLSNESPVQIGHVLKEEVVSDGNKNASIQEKKSSVQLNNVSYGTMAKKSEREIKYRNVARDYSTKRLPLKPIDINRADTLAFQQLPGIGSKLANRIVLYRKKLGGFTSVEQVGQVYGLKDSVYKRIKPSLIVVDNR